MYVYILHSSSLNKYYIGQTQDMKERLIRHNSGREKYTKAGTPWNLAWFTKCDTRSDAMKLEKKIKGRGASRFLIDIEV